jgi:hypothetical protein
MKLNIGKPAHFQNEAVPDGTRLAGWAALVHALDVEAPVRNPACISERHVRGNRRREGIWEIYDKRYHRTIPWMGISALLCAMSRSIFWFSNASSTRCRSRPS